MRGYFGIGIDNVKKIRNIGTLWRSANILGASFIFTIGNKYHPQRSDTMTTPRHVPLFHYNNFENFYANIPVGCKLIGVEIDDRSVPVERFIHPESSIYLLGSESRGLSESILNKCNTIVQLPGDFCLNVSVAGSLLMYDRYVKNKK